VQHLGTPVRYGWPVYLQIADAGGFYSFDFLLDNETADGLNNEEYNVFMWPYLPEPATYGEQFVSLSNSKGMEAIRSFVRNGGGYIGSCYGAFAASSGFLHPFASLSLQYAYNPYLSCKNGCYGLSLSDSLMWHKFTGFPTHYLATNTVINTSHPLFFGVNHTITDFFKGPWFVWLGQNTQVLAEFSDINAREPEDINPVLLRKVLVGRPNYVTTTFGSGKVILFSSHPEFVSNIPPLFSGQGWDGDPYYGLRILHNALWYTTSVEDVTVETLSSYPKEIITNWINRTTDLPLTGPPGDQFTNIALRITDLSGNLSNFELMTIDLQTLFEPLENNSNIFADGKRLLRYTLVYCWIFQEYINKTLSTIETLEYVIPLIPQNNSLFEYRIINIQKELSTLLNNTDMLIRKVIKKGEYLQKLLSEDKVSFLNKIHLLQERKQLLNLFETGLKYIPQLYFETTMLLRHLWYSYEASQAQTVIAR
jgi:hypothetical protein